MNDAKPLYDVIEVEIANPENRRVMATGKTEENAEAYIKIAVARRGVETHFYMKRKAAPASAV